MFLDNYLAIVKLWMQDMGLNSSGMVEQLQSVARDGLLVADPSPAVRAIPQTGGVRPSLAEARRDLRPSKGIATLKLTAFIYGSLVRELAQIRTLDAIRTRVGGPAGSAGNLKGQFWERMQMGHISYFQTGFSENPNSWLDNIDTLYIQLPEGIVAYQQLKFRGKKYPGVIAIAPPPVKAKVIECGPAIAASSRVIWHNQRIQEQMEMARLLEQLGLFRDLIPE